MQPPKKTQYWFSLDQSYEAISTGFPSVEGVIYERGSRIPRQGLTFTVDDSDLEGVKFQVTRKDKLGIFAPEEVDLEIMIAKIKPYLDKAAGAPVKLTHILSSAERDALFRGKQITVALSPEVRGRERQRQPPHSVEDVLVVDALKRIFAMQATFDAAKEYLRHCGFPEDHLARLNEVSTNIDLMAGLASQLVINRFGEMSDEILKAASSIPEKYRSEYGLAIDLASLDRRYSTKVVNFALKATFDYTSELSALVDSAATTGNETGSFWRFLQHELEKVRAAVGAIKTV